MIWPHRQGRDVRPCFEILGGLNHVCVTRLTCQSDDKMAGIRGPNLNGLRWLRHEVACLIRKPALLSKAIICRGGEIVRHACDQT